MAGMNFTVERDVMVRIKPGLSLVLRVRATTDAGAMTYDGDQWAMNLSCKVNEEDAALLDWVAGIVRSERRRRWLPWHWFRR